MLSYAKKCTFSTSVMSVSHEAWEIRFSASPSKGFPVANQKYVMSNRKFNFFEGADCGTTAFNLFLKMLLIVQEILLKYFTFWTCNATWHCDKDRPTYLKPFRRTQVSQHLFIYLGSCLYGSIILIYFLLFIITLGTFFIIYTWLYF